MAKKIISILLAIIIMVGTLAIGTFADTQREPQTYKYYNDPDFNEIVTKSAATESKEMTKLYPGDIIQICTSNSFTKISVTYLTNDGFSVSDPSVKSFTDNITNATEFTVLNIEDETSSGKVIDFVVDGNYNFLYWIVEKEISIVSKAANITLIAVYDIPESEEIPEKTDAFTFIMDYIHDLNNKLVIEPFWAMVKAFHLIKEEIYDFFNQLLDPIIPKEVPEEPTTLPV